MSAYLKYLGLEEDADERAIKRAYAHKLKQIDQEKDPAGFQALREAYEAALHRARRQAADQVHDDKHSGPEPVPLAEQDAVSVVAIEPDLDSEAAKHRKTEQEESPDVDARAVFSELAGSLTAAPHDLAQVRSLFDLAIDDPRLIRVETRDLFEWYVGQYLAQGWRPGNECLLQIAIKHFNWQDDRRRLYRFGRVGAILDHAIHEMNAFVRQQEHARQLDLIRALRLSERPSNGKLADGLPALEEIARRFPTLFPLIASEENLERWRLWTKDVNSWRRKLGQSRARGIVRASNPSRKNGSWGKSLSTIFVVMAVLSALSNVMKSKSPAYSPESHLPSMAQPHSSRGTGSSTPDSAANIDTDWLSRSPTVPGNLTALLAKEPDLETCAEVAAIAEAYPAGLSQQNRIVGARLDNRIATCASMMLLPATFSDIAVRAAIERQTPRLKSVQ